MKHFVPFLIALLGISAGPLPQSVAAIPVAATSNPINDALARVGQEPLSATTGQAVSAAGVTVKGDSTAIAREISGGGQVIDVLASGEDTTSFVVSSPSGYKLERVGNAVGVVKRNSVNSRTGTQSIEVHTVFDSPWAFDAAGRALATHYEIQGNRLVQKVDTRGATYPIVADPSFTRGDYKFSWSILSPASVTVEANKRGSRVISNGGTAALCLAIAFVPVFGTALAAICGATVILDNVVYEYGRCLRLTFNAITRQVSRSYYTGGFCT